MLICHSLSFVSKELERWAVLMSNEPILLPLEYLLPALFRSPFNVMGFVFNVTTFDLSLGPWKEHIGNCTKWFSHKLTISKKLLPLLEHAARRRLPEIPEPSTSIPVLCGKCIDIRPSVGDFLSAPNSAIVLRRDGESNLSFAGSGWAGGWLFLQW